MSEQIASSIGLIIGVGFIIGMIIYNVKNRDKKFRAKQEIVSVAVVFTF